MLYFSFRNWCVHSLMYESFKKYSVIVTEKMDSIVNENYFDSHTKNNDWNGGSIIIIGSIVIRTIKSDKTKSVIKSLSNTRSSDFKIYMNWIKQQHRECFLCTQIVSQTETCVWIC